MSQQQRRQPQPPPAAATVKPHVLGASSTFAGRIVHNGRVEIWGHFRGQLRALEVSIKNGGRVDGQIEANLIRNDGSLCGTVRAQCLETSRRSRIEGEIKISELGMEKGCRIGPNTQLMTPDPKMIPVLTVEGLSAEIAEIKAAKSRERGTRPLRAQDVPMPDEHETPRPYLVRSAAQ